LYRAVAMLDPHSGVVLTVSVLPGLDRINLSAES
jgi:hypothetical protein